jgi:phosphoribosylglycinamide formyltransferase-1
VLPADDEATLHERIKVVERALLVETVAAIASRGVRVDGRRAVIGTLSSPIAPAAGS